MRDLLDGYFPYELKHAYPEGVLFSVTDHTARAFGMPGEYVWGAGRKLDSRDASRPPVATDGAPAAPSAPAAAPASGGGAVGGGRALTTGARMWNNPADAANSGSEAAGGAGVADGLSPQAAAVLLSPGALVCSGTADGDSAGAATGGVAGTSAPCRIQVKGTDGQMACVLELPSSATLASVHAALLGKAIVAPQAKYELRTAFPARTLTEVNATLLDLGLAPSATLCVRLTGAR